MPLRVSHDGAAISAEEALVQVAFEQAVVEQKLLGGLKGGVGFPLGRGTGDGRTAKPSDIDALLRNLPKKTTLDGDVVTAGWGVETL